MRYKAFIVEIDRDYNCYVDTTQHEVSSTEEAQELCDSQRWSGAYYYVDRVIPIDDDSILKHLAEDLNLFHAK